MKLYLISQDSNDEWDVYLSAVVVASGPAKAKKIHPSGDNESWNDNNWVSSPDKVHCLHIGEAKKSLKEGEVICADYNKG